MRQFLIFLVIFLTSCGGGGQSSSQSSSSNNLPAVAYFTISGRVIDPPVSGSRVFLDLNCNKQLDSGEYSATSTPSGFFGISLPRSIDLDTDCGAQIVSVGGVDTSDNTAPQTATLVNNKIQDIDDANVVLSPLSTVSSYLNEAEVDLLLDSLGITDSAQTVFEIDIWSKEEEDPTNDLLNSNLVLNNLLSATTSLFGEASDAEKVVIQEVFADTLITQIATLSDRTVIYDDFNQIKTLSESLVANLSNASSNTLNATLNAAVANVNLNSFYTQVVATNSLIQSSAIDFSGSSGLAILNASKDFNVELSESLERGASDAIATLIASFNSDLSDGSIDLDTDGDGIGNNTDTDDDGDGVGDSSDAFPLLASETIDTDGDGIGNNADTDDDGDRVPDALDSFPLDSIRTIVDAEACVALANLSIPNVSITSAEITSKKSNGSTDALYSYCRVKLVAGTQNNIEIFLPDSSIWNGRYLAVGNGGLAGIIGVKAMDNWVESGYATSGSDTGHTFGDPDELWLLNQERVIDYAYRAVHEMALATNEIIENYYKLKQDYSYWNNCSTGGRQGLMEAQRYPGDFDGIVAGAPVNDFVRSHAAQAWVSYTARPDASGPYGPIYGKIPLASSTEMANLNSLVMTQCDGLDGVTDGIINNPRACTPDLSSLLTLGWSQYQLDAVENIWGGWKNSSGDVLGGAWEVGSQSGNNWTFTANPYFPFGKGPLNDAFAVFYAYFRHIVFEDLNFDWRSISYDTLIDTARPKTALIDAIDPDLADFQARGAKLIIYHGWNDSLIPPGNSIEYYNSLKNNLVSNGYSQQLADTEIERFARLYMIPGIGHCGTNNPGGDGLNTVEFQSYIENWVENGIAPGAINADQKSYSGVTLLEKIVCPYPQQIKYNAGDNTLRSSYFCE